MDDNVDSKPLILGGLAFLVCSWLVHWLFKAATSPLRTIPGPWYSIFTNLVLKRAITSGKRIFYIDNLHRRYGPIVRISPNEVAVSDVDGFKQIHATSAKRVFVKDVWYEKLTNFPRHSVFTMRDPKEHAQRRRLFARSFSKTYLRQHWESTVHDMCRLAVDKIRQDATSGRADLLKWWSFMAADVVGKLGFGESFGLLELGKKTEYIRILEAALKGNGIGAELPLVRSVLARVPYKPLQEAFNSTSYILGYGQKAVNNAQQHGEQSCLMAAVLAEALQENTTLDALDVQTESTSLIFAGSGTTANTMTYFIWCVLARPKLQKALEAELGALNEDELTDARLEQLPLLNATLQETLRLYAAVPGSLPRVAPSGGAVIAGYYIPEGTTCSTQAYTLHRDPSAWMSPYEFNPYRHLPSHAASTPPDMAKNAKVTFSAWGAGAYTCLGQHLAWMEMRFAAAHFFRECKGAALGPTTNEDMEMENYFVITPKGKKCEITLEVDGSE